MTDVNSLNAVTRDRARIREALLKGQGNCLNIETNRFEIDAPPKMVTVNKAVYIRLADVLATLTDNVQEPHKVPVRCACCPKDDTITWHAHPSRSPMFIPKGIHPNQVKTAEDIAAVTDKPGEKIPESEWNLDRFIAKPIMLHAHDAGADKPILQNASIGFVPVVLPGNEVTRLVVMDYGDGKVYVYPDPHTSDLEEWISENTHHRFSEIEWMITEEPFAVKP